MRMHGGGFCFHYLFVYNLCRHILYTTGPGAGAPGDTAPPVLVRPYGAEKCFT